MNMHISGTWLLANLLHPVLLFLFMGNSGDYSLFDLAGGYFSTLFFSLIFSSPSLWLSFLWGYLISGFSLTSFGKYIAWIISAPLLIIINMQLILLFFAGEINFSEINFCVPAMIAVEIIILIRYNQFINCFNQLKEKKHENNLV
jgi:hypothetical protein